MADKYIGFDKVAKAKKPGLEMFVVLCGKRWKFRNLGTLNVRLMRSAPKGMKIGDEGAEKWMSVHATGRACDLGYHPTPAGIAATNEAIAWLTRDDVVKALDVQEVHDYSAVSNPKHPTAKKWGRGWRRGRGWKEWSATDNGGTPMGKWIHVELGPKVADLDKEAFIALWKSIPK